MRKRKYQRRERGWRRRRKRKGRNWKRRKRKRKYRGRKLENNRIGKRVILGRELASVIAMMKKER